MRVAGLEEADGKVEKRGSAGSFSNGWKAKVAWRFRTNARVSRSGTRTRIPQTERGEPSEPLEGELSEIQPVVLEVVRSDEQRLLFRELVDRHHYLGPRGSLWRSSALSGVRIGAARVVGCVQLSSPAWRMAARDLWIGWDDATRGPEPAASG